MNERQGKAEQKLTKQRSWGCYYTWGDMSEPLFLGMVVHVIPTLRRWRQDNWGWSVLRSEFKASLQYIEKHCLKTSSADLRKDCLFLFYVYRCFAQVCVCVFDACLLMDSRRAPKTRLQTVVTMCLKQWTCSMLSHPSDTSYIFFFF